MFKNLSKYGSVVVVILLSIAGIYILSNYLSSKGNSSTKESMSKNSNPAYYDDGIYAPIKQKTTKGNNALNGSKISAAPKDLIVPTSQDSYWEELNPSGEGELANVNLLRAGHNIGIDTVGQSLRNANQQLRSEPANPQTYTGPWNQSTITPDFQQVPLEIGQGPQ